jgi:hypothetical protein
MTTTTTPTEERKRQIDEWVKRDALDTVLLALAESDEFPLDHHEVDDLLAVQGVSTGGSYRASFTELWPDDDHCENEEFKLAHARTQLLASTMLASLAELSDYCRGQSRELAAWSQKRIAKREEPWVDA